MSSYDHSVLQTKDIIQETGPSSQGISSNDSSAYGIRYEDQELEQNIEIDQIYGGENMALGDCSDSGGGKGDNRRPDFEGSLQKFDKDNLGEFEWFVDNVFLMSDRNSMWSEKTRNVTWVNRGVDVGG
jgi:hypothetical protein